MSQVLGTKLASQATPPISNSTVLSNQTTPLSNSTVLSNQTAPVTSTVLSGQQQTSTGRLATAAILSVASPASLSTNLTEASQEVVVPTEMGSQVANPKEKTPMCLLNELARFNRLQPKYELIDQTGPPHLKVFSVQLCLGDKKYDATGSSIKKAQHEAAKSALRESTLPKPQPRPPSTRTHKFNPNPDALTATVLLNGYSMKNGVAINYTTVQSAPIDGPSIHQHPYNPYGHQQVYYPNYRRNMYPHPTRMVSVILNVAGKEYNGDGRNMKEAKQNAAAKALMDLKEAGEDVTTLTKDQATSTACSDAQTETNKGAFESDEVGKSEISLVYELAHPHNLNVEFEVLEESGPAHMKKFKMRCMCGEFVCDGEGLSKKQAKHHAANAMLKKLQTLPQKTPSYRPRPRFQKNKKKTKSISKAAATSPELNAALNPISRLVQILQKQEKKVEAMFTVIQEKKLPVRRREFTMQCVAGPHKCTGVGPTKKAAKKASAEEMLRLMGYESEPVPSVRPALKKSTGDPGLKEEKSERKVTFAADSKGRSIGLVPGLLPMLPGMNAPGFAGINRVPQVASNNKQSQLTAAIARELLTNGSSETAAELIKTAKSCTPGLEEDAKLVRPKHQLEYLGQLQGLGVHFQDFPKGNTSEFMSLVSVTTNPKLVAHGSGLTTEASHDAASMTALKLLSEINKAQDVGERI
ncbi:double-stranded RNA-binding protein Staufen homolog 2-like [Anneissia japonica]|uniref:double-stranded RNA-binding protein Staufen homolog 2-like n=1 Tax=Anneissia japonica TaxID=1529436 RepID=UPI0014258C0D|nr:double-stranded RNA-binding protein Staufen homolog 2-like [Anneissia japonica]